MTTRLKILFVLVASLLFSTGAGNSHTETALRSLGSDSEAIPEIARAIDSATQDRFERLLLASVAWHESRFAEDVAHCERLGDSGKATGAWQTWALPCPLSVEEQAQEALRHLRSTMAFCKGASEYTRAIGAISLYATGKSCVWSGADKRWATMKALSTRM